MTRVGAAAGGAQKNVSGASVRVLRRSQAARVGRPLMAPGATMRAGYEEFRQETCKGRLWYAASAGMAGMVGLAGAVSLVGHATNSIVSNEGGASSQDFSGDDSDGGEDTSEDGIRDSRTFSKADVAAHSTRERGVWVTYGRDVYDITDFVDAHPGGPERIMMAKGGPVEPFWALYRQHLTPQVQDILKPMRIGQLDPAEAAGPRISDANDPYESDPTDRHPGLVVLQDKPFNAETPLALIPDNFLTPAALWYVRHHHPVPQIDPDKFQLEVAAEAGPVADAAASFSLSDLKSRFSMRTVTATMQCGGNRRSELNAVRKTQGLPWGAGAISTATWGGVYLRDVLVAMGVPPDPTQAAAAGVRHVHFVGADEPYDASVPVEIAMDPSREVLVAFEMNGEPIPREHGAPLRVIVPGTIGARNVKWVKKIIVSSEEAHSNWQRGLPYKVTPPAVTDLKDANPAVLPSVQDLPVQSAICVPSEGAVVEAEPAPDGTGSTVTVQGYAWSGGGRPIFRVDVSADGGSNWTTAQLVAGHDQPYGRSWAWTLWKADVPVPRGVSKQGGSVELVCKAVDGSLNTQPASGEPIWNPRGILSNAYSRVTVEIDADE